MGNPLHQAEMRKNRMCPTTLGQRCLSELKCENTNVAYYNCLFAGELNEDQAY